MDDKKYLTEYYSKNSKPTQASTFAKFILPKLESNKNLIERSCGNARDSIYFAQNNLNVIAVDQVREEIDYLTENHDEENILFVCDDFTNLTNTPYNIINETDFDYIYSRFTFHSINEAKEDRTLDWIENNLDKDGCFLLEARSLNDPMFKQGKSLSGTENYTTH